MIGFAFYLKLMMLMYVDKPTGADGYVEISENGELSIIRRVAVPPSVIIVLAVTVAATLWWGLFPQSLMGFSADAGIFFGQ